MTTHPRGPIPKFSELRIMRLPGPGGLWKLTRPLYYGKIVVPGGFTSDGNSNPIKHPASEAAGWLHDYLYRADVCYSRALADRLFYEALRSEGVSTTRAYMQWLMVRLAGWRYWQRLSVTIAREDY